jgi:hypothetical protein
MCTQVCTHVYTYVYTSYVLTGHCVVCQGGALTYYISVVVMTSDVYTCVYTCDKCVYMCTHVYKCVHMCTHVYTCVYTCNVVFMCASNNIQIVFVHEKTHHHKLVRQLELLAVNDVKQY